jgi:cupin 2 domain-containing protein
MTADEPQSLAGGNLFSGVPAELPEELVAPLLQRPGLRIERIVSRGHASPEGFWYDQPTDEWVVLLSGAAVLEFQADGRRMELQPGDYVYLPRYCRHRVASTAAQEPSVWLAVHIDP